ncbi:MAG TPA: nucleoside-diphosphate sugar epimerase/dehydratase [Longimicrobiales bacterium]
MNRALEHEPSSNGAPYHRGNGAGADAGKARRWTRVAARVYAALDRHRGWAALAAYAALTVAGYTIAFLLRFELHWRSEYTVAFATSLPALLAIRIALARAFRLSSGRWRFIGTRDVLRLAIATAAGSVIFFVATRISPVVPLVPRSVVLIEWVLTTYLTAGAWIAYRTSFEQIRHRRAGFNGSARRVLIVGAGEAGHQLAREMARVPTGYRPIGFVDDDPAKRGTRLHGLPVFGTTAELARTAAREGAEEIIIAIPSASPAELRRIVEIAEAADVPFKVLPGIASVLTGGARVDLLREVRIEDLLGREPIRLELPELAADLRGRAVLITGAAGSIGSELARQIALHGPGRLILFDQAETELYYLELDLRERFPDLDLVPVIGDVVDAGSVERAFNEFAPSRVFHAAAYKHVPMMESNPREAVRNNVIGTWRVADAAGRHGAEKFVLISTDKAVRPTSTMGATKRLAELAMLELQDRHPGTVYGAVRFGNVLGSSGSVIPIFKRQLAAGKPLTVTHPDATRYFMTIPEAVQLVLQASLLEELRGQIAMLEMGDPVRIVDMAMRLLRLSGAVNGNGKRLTFVGLRPGEKLHEELVAPDEIARPTAIAKVRLVESARGPAESILRRIEQADRDVDATVDGIVGELSTIFPLLNGKEHGRQGVPAVQNGTRPHV